MNPLRLSAVLLAFATSLACTSSDETPAPEPEPVDASVPEPSKPSEGSFVLTLAKDKLPILQGTSEELHVTIERKPGFSGELKLSASGLPEGVSVAEVRVAQAADEAMLVFRATASAPHSLPTEVKIRGSAVEGSAQAEKPLTVTVYGPPGSLDTSFAGGKVMVPMGASDDYARALAVAADGKIVVAGQRAENRTDFSLLRLQRDGTLDASFGSNGVVATQVGSGADIAYAVAVQKDGKILAAGNTEVSGSGLDFALVRYNVDGTVDKSFGDDGIVTTTFGTDSDTAYAVLVQPDGKIVLGGESNQGSSKTGVDFALARYNTDGSLDETFGDHGKVLTAISTSSGGDSVYALAFTEKNGEARILAAGGEGDFKAVCYREDGSLDSSFGEAGKVSGLLGSSIGAARAIAVTTDGGILLAGHRAHDFALARLKADGKLDANFGEGGIAITAVSASNWDEAKGLAVEADGNIVLGGWVYEGNGTSGNFALARYTEDGALDTTFGDEGIVITEVAQAQRRDEGAAVWLQSDERVPTVRVLLAGSASASNSDFAVTRYWR